MQNELSFPSEMIHETDIDDLSAAEQLTDESGISLTPSTQSTSTLSSPSPPPSSIDSNEDFFDDRQKQEDFASLFRAEDIGVDEDETNEEICFFCGLTPQAARLKGFEIRQCQHCNDIYACSKVHYDIHRPHNTCFPFIIKRSKTIGRYMVASKDIAPCELILSEEAAVVGPYAKTVPGCLQCFKKVDDSYLCPGCNFPMCNETCANGNLHRDECRFFQASNFRADTGGTTLDAILNNNNSSPSLITRKLTRGLRASSNLVCITPLRMLLKRETDPKVFALLNMLMDHESLEGERKVRDKQINLPLVNAAIMLQEVSFRLDTFSQLDIQRMIGILRTNGMKMEPHGDKGIPGVVIYPIYCLINHACYNNTNYVKFPDLHLELRSQLPIKKGEQIYTRYVSSTIGNLRRREDINRYWFFDCNCRRCCDATEFGTNMSAILCFACNKGYVLPINSLEYKSEWECVSCHNRLPYETIDEVLSAMEHQVRTCGSKRPRAFIRGPPTPKALGPWSEKLTEIFSTLQKHSSQKLVDYEHCETHVLEEMLYHFSKILHPNHYILIDIMHNLVHVYASKAVLSRPEKERKIQLCVTVLETLGKVDPGFTKWRGTLLQELIHPLMLISKEDHAAGRISAREFQRRLGFCTRKLSEARKCLNDGFSPVKEQVPKESKGRILERRAKQKI